MSHCINISHPEVKKLSEELKLPKVVVASKIATWQTITGNMDTFPTTGEIKSGLESTSLRPDTLPEYGVPDRFDKSKFSHITDQYIIPGLGLDKTNDLIGYIAAVVGMNIESFTPKNVKEWLDVVKGEFEEDLNSKYGKDLQIALNYWIELSAMAIEELKQYSTKFQDTPEEAGMNYMEERAVQTDGKREIDKELREFFRFIPSGQKSFINTDVYLSFDMVYNTLSATLAGRHAKYADMKAELLTIQEFKPWMPHVIQALDNASEKIRNQFVKAMSKHYVDMQTVRFWTNAMQTYGMDQKMYSLRGEDKKVLTEGVLQVINTNRNAVEQVILKEWQARQKIVPGFLEVNTKTGKTIINPETRAKLLEDYETLLDAPSAMRDKLLIKWLSDMGIEMSLKSLEILRTRAYAMYKMNYNSLFTNKGGVFAIIAQILDSKLENESEDSFFYNNPLSDQAVKKLTQVEAEIADRWFSQSHKDGENNTIFSYTQNKMIFDQLRDMIYDDADDSLLRKRLSNPFNSTSEWGQNMLKGNKLKSVINVRYLDTLRGATSNRGGVKLKNQSSKEMELTTIGLLQNVNSIDSEGNRVVGFITPTMSDKVTPIIIDAIAHNTSVIYDKETGDIKDLGSTTLNSLYRIFLAEYKRISAMNLKSDDDKAKRVDGYENGSMLFYFFPELNNNPIVCEPTSFTDAKGETITIYDNKNLKKDLQPANIQAIKGVLVNRVKTMARELKQEWIDYEIVKEDKMRGFIFTYLNKGYMTKVAGPATETKFDDANELSLDLLKRESLEKLNYAVMDYTVNYMIANANIFQLFMMDPAFSYKKDKDDNTALQNTYINLGKRLAMNIAPGTDFPETFDEFYEFAVIEDVESGSKNLKQIRDVLKSTGIAEKIVNKYLKISGADGQEYVTVDEELYLMFKEGSITSEERNKASKILNDPNADLHSLEGRKALDLILKPRKPVYTSIIDNTDLGISYPVYIKSSSFPLIPAITKGLSIDKLRVAMLNAKDSKGEPSPISRVAYRSAVKLGAFVGKDGKAAPAINEDGSFKDDIDFTDFRMTLSRNGLRNQQEIPFDETKNKINDGTQQRKLLFSGLLRLKTFTLDGKNISGLDLQSDFNQTYIKLFNGQLEKLNKRLKVDKNGKVQDKTLSDILKEEIEAGEGFSINDKYAVELKDGKFTFPLSLTPSADKIESLLISLGNNNIRKIKLPGLSYVLGSEEGFSRYENIEDYSKDEKQGIITKKGFDLSEGLKPMRYVHKDGSEITGKGRDVFNIKNIADYKIAPAQVLVPFKFRDNDGNLLDINDFIKDGHIDTTKIPEELLTIFGFRIPTQGLNSMSMIEIVGFLPQAAGDLLIGTKDWVTQMGSDFDIDKLYTYVYATDFKDGKLSKNTGDVESLQNHLLDIHFSVLSNTDPKVQAQIIHPLVTDKLEDDANKIFKARRKRFSQPGQLEETLLSRTYQKQKFINATSGKLGTAVKSLLSTFSASCQEKNIYFGVKTKEGVEKVNIIFGQANKDGNVESVKLNSLSTTVDWYSNTKQSNISMQQSASVDNEKLQILDKINSNEITFPFENTLLAVGFDVTISDHMTAQDILFDYVTELRRVKDSTATEYVANPEQEVKNRLHAKYAAKVGITVKELHDQLYGEDMPTGMDYPFTTEELFNMIENGEKAQGLPYNYAVMQALVLDKFLEITEIGKDMSNVQSAINTDSAGLGKNFFETLYKEEQVDNIKMNKATYVRNAIELLGELTEESKAELMLELPKVIIDGEEVIVTASLVFNPTTIAGVATENTLYTINKYFSNHFPYQNRAVQRIIKEIEEIKGIKSENVTVRAEFHKKIWNHMKSAIYSAQASGLTLDSIGNERLRLFHDDPLGEEIPEGYERNKSLALRVLEFQQTDEGKKNAFIRALQPDLYVDNHSAFPSLSLLTFNNAAADNFSERNYYVGYIELLTSSDPEIRKLAIDLAIYAYLAGGRQEATQFTKFINYELLEQLGFASFLKNLNYNDVLGIPDQKLTYYDVPKFVRQFFQHEPNETRTLKSSMFDDMVTESIDEKTGKPINVRVGLIITDEGIKAANYMRKTSEGVVAAPPPFVSIYDSEANSTVRKGNKKTGKKYKLYQYIGNNQYQQIDTLGQGQLYSEYDIDKSFQRTLIDGNAGEMEELPQILRRLDAGEPVVKNPSTVFTLAEKYHLEGDTFSKETLQDIIDNSSNEWFRTLAKLYLDNFDKLMKTKLILSDTLAAKAEFTWSKDKQSLTINMSRNTSAEDLEESILHELTHAFVNRTIQNPSTDEEKSIVESLRRMHKKFISTINADPVLKAKYDDFISKWNTDKHSTLRQPDSEFFLNYAANDILEFTSLMMANKEFRDFCKAIPFTGKQSIWDRFVELIHNMLKVLGLKKGTIASGTISNVVSLIENKNQLDALFGNEEKEVKPVKTYTNHSGGAQGADLMWDKIGREYEVTNHKHYRPEDLSKASAETKQKIEKVVRNAAKGLGRPTSEFKGKDLVRRNWFQVNGADEIFAVSRIVEPGADDKGFKNKSGKQVVSGGTGWAVEMAIQAGKPVHVFDQNTNKWYKWDVFKNKFIEESTPILSQNFAGIGSRQLTTEGTQAIKDVYTETFEQSSLRPDFQSIINKLDERLTTVQKNLITHKIDTKRVSILTEREKAIKEKLHILRTYPEQIGAVLDAGSEEMSELVTMIDGQKEFSFQDIVYMDSILHSWEDVNKILSTDDLTLLEGTDKFTANTEELLNIEKIARAYRVKWVDIAQKAYSNLAHKDSAFVNSDLFKPLVEMGIFRTAMLDASHNTAELVQYVDKLIKKSLVRIERAQDLKTAELNESLKEFKLTSQYKEGKFDILLQKDTNGKYTGNLEDAYVQEYYDIQDKLKQDALDATTVYARKTAWRKYFQWKAANTITMDARKLYYDEYKASGGTIEYTPDEIADYEKYLKEQLGNALFDKMKLKVKEKLDYFLKLQKEAYLRIDDMGEDEEATADLKEFWDVENSPFYYSDKINDGIDYKKSEKEYVNMQGWKHSVEVAKRTNKAGKDLGWYSKHFETIYADPALRNFYEKTLNILNEMYGYLPPSYRKNIKENSIPVIAKTVLEAYAKDGMSNAMGVWKDNFIHSITESQSNVDNRNKSKNDNPERHLPIKYMPSDTAEQRAKEAEYKSYDIEKVVKLFSKMALTYKYKAEIEDIVRIGQQLLHESLEQRVTASGMPVLGRDGKPWTISNSLKNIKAQMDYLVDTFYDESRKNQGPITLKEGKMKEFLTTKDEKEAKKLIKEQIKELQAKFDAKEITEDKYEEELSKLEDNLASYDKTVILSNIGDKILWYVQLKGMGWNVFSAFQNVTFGWLSNFIHSAAGEDFTDKELTRANGILLNSILKSISGELVANKVAKKVAKLMHKYHVLHDRNEANYGKEEETTVGGILKALSPFELQQRGEYFAQGQAFVAHLIHTKVNGKSLWDVYDEDGNLPDGTEWTEDQDIDIKLHIDQMLKLIHGNYDPNSRVIIKSGILGRALMQFRSWIAEGAINRFGDKHYDKLLRRDRKGRYRTYATFIQDKGVLSTIGHSIIGMLNKSVFDKSGLDAVDIANMKKNSRELLLYTSMMGLGIVLSMMRDGEDDDKDKLKYATFLLNTNIRMQQDINFFYNPKSARSILKNFIPASQLMVDVYNWNEAAYRFILGDDEIKTGIYAHESRLLRRTAQLLPLGTQIYRQRDAFEQVIRH